jgi:hypothetical protein
MAVVDVLLLDNGRMAPQVRSARNSLGGTLLFVRRKEGAYAAPANRTEELFYYGQSNPGNDKGAYDNGLGFSNSKRVARKKLNSR